MLASAGLDLVDFSLKLLEKVEESTLYILQMHEQLGSLEARMLDLEVCPFFLAAVSCSPPRPIHATCKISHSMIAAKTRGRSPALIGARRDGMRAT